MLIKINHLKYEPRISLYLVPESDIERGLLKFLWNHGKLELTNGVADGSSQGYCITTKERLSDITTSNPDK